MLRLTEIKLPLDHSEDDLKDAILVRLGIAADELIGYSISRRGFDARKLSAIQFVYTLEVEVRDETALLEPLKNAPLTPLERCDRRLVQPSPSGESLRVAFAAPCRQWAWSAPPSAPAPE